jgi:hypothetical protein
MRRTASLCATYAKNGVALLAYVPAIHVFDDIQLDVKTPQHHQRRPRAGGDPDSMSPVMWAAVVILGNRSS